MKYYHIKHFLKKDDAENLFEKIIEDNGLKEDIKADYFWRYASKDGFWVALDDKTMNTVTLIADMPFELKDFFTVVEYNDDAQKFSFKSHDMRRFTLKHRRQDQAKYSRFLSDLGNFSNSNFLMETFYDRFISAFNVIVELDHEIYRDYNWRVPEDSSEEFLSKIESLLDNCGSNYSKMESNYNLAKVHFMNTETLKKKIGKDYGVKLKIDYLKSIIYEMDGKIANSKVIYKRITDMKDITVGKESLRLQKYAIRIQHAAIIIEAFIIYAYTFYIWIHVNPKGFENTQIPLKYIIPMLIAIGTVFFVESTKSLKIWKYLKIKKWKSLIFFLIALILILTGFYLINL